MGVITDKLRDLQKTYKDNIVCHRGGHGGGIEWVDR